MVGVTCFRTSGAVCPLRNTCGGRSQLFYNVGCSVPASKNMFPHTYVTSPRSTLSWKVMHCSMLEWSEAACRLTASCSLLFTSWLLTLIFESSFQPSTLYIYMAELAISDIRQDLLQFRNFWLTQVSRWSNLRMKEFRPTRTRCALSTALQVKTILLLELDALCPNLSS